MVTEQNRTEIRFISSSWSAVEYNTTSGARHQQEGDGGGPPPQHTISPSRPPACLLYTSDAADE